jgi:hypothetical protein
MSLIDVPRAGSLWQRALAAAFCALGVYPAATVVAQVSRLAPAAPPVEIVDPSERISGNATPGLLIVHEGDKIGADRLWAYLSEPVGANLKLRISSIDGRYYAEVDYATDSRPAGWVALDLSLRSFSFLESNYTDPLNQIAAVLSDADAPRLYPLRWAVPHRGVTAPPPPPKDDDPLRIYMNTERATAFVVVDGQPSYCRDASEVSGFKFNAICDVTLGALRLPADDGAPHVVEGIAVLRRQGVRTLAPLNVDVRIRY